MRSSPWLASPAVSLLAGVAQALALADPWAGQPRWWLQLASLAVLVWQLARYPMGWRGGFWRGWLFGLGWLAGTFWWLFISMHTYGGMAAPLAAAAVLALAGALALYYGLAAAVFVALARGRGPVEIANRLLRRTLGFAALWTLAELARGTLFTGFPWGAGGYAHVDGPLAGWAPWVGVYGIGFVAAWLAALMTQLTAIGPLRSARLFVYALGLWYLMVVIAPLDNRAGALPPMTVALLQGNIPQDEKFVPGTGVADSLAWYGEQLRSASAPLVVAPETALPVLPQQLPDGYWQALAGRFAQPGQAALLGVPLGDPRRGFTNSVVGLAPGQGEAPYRYDKHHLVPFGEFTPPLFRWFERLLDMPLGDFERGATNQPSLRWQGQRLAPNICYEDLFGEELAARFADPANAPTALVNVSNIGWFGDTVAIDQHLQISRMRALEFARPVLRATNTGATAIIDYRGRVTRQLPRLTRGVLTGQFEGRTGLTPYARWAAAWGLWPLVAVCALLAAWMAFTRSALSAGR